MIGGNTISNWRKLENWLDWNHKERAVTVVRKSNGQFGTGWQGGPGRPIGMRNRLSESALAALGADFAEHGPEVIKQVRETRPHHYLSIIASLLPRQLQVERSSPLAELTDDELTLIEETLRAGRAQLVPEPDPEDTKQQGS
jgi:hypothetical protein